MTANKERCAQEANSSIALSTVVATSLGFSMGVKVAHYGEQTGKNVCEAVVEMGLMTNAEAHKLVDPMLMTHPHAADPGVEAFKKEKNLT